MKSTRILNGYIVIYKPAHPKAMKSINWNGYVYEHIVIAEEDYGRPLKDDEVVHHLDLDRANNNPANLVVLPKRSHGKIHKWIENGGTIRDTVNGEDIDLSNYKRCKTCDKPLKSQQKQYCSNGCVTIGTVSKLDDVGLNELLEKLSTRSMVSVAKDYNMSDNGLRKHLKSKHNLCKETLKTALDVFKLVNKI